MTIGGARPRPAGLALQDSPLPQTRGAGRTIWEERNMKKRLISWLLILALCVSILPAAALAAELEAAAESVAETTAEPTGTKQTITPAEPLRAVTSGTGTHAHYLCGETDACNKEGHDEGDNKVTFTAWPGINSVVNGGAYYLTTDLNGLTVKSGVNLTLCLNGCSITGGVGWPGYHGRARCDPHALRLQRHIYPRDQAHRQRAWHRCACGQDCRNRGYSRRE